MRKIIVSTALLLFLIPVPNGASEGQTKPNQMTVEGAIMAIRKGTRHVVKPEAKSIDTPVELWVVRIDSWIDNPSRNGKFILIQYSLRARALSDDEINQPRLRFSIRDRREDEHTDCLGMMLVVDKKPYTTRPVELNDYERTEPGKYEAIPSLETLPCFIAEHPPVIIE